tara:strand:- start:194 stop:607 length:414 start_codon:yes stop_codon:yes gene_type:complete
MGYRSQVALAVAPELAGAFLSLFAKNKEVEDLCRNADRFDSGYEQEGDYFMFWDHLKWYDSFPEIADIMHFIESVESDDMSEYGLSDAPKGKTPNGSEYDCNWDDYIRYVRIGEDTDDVDIKGGYALDINISRDISF